ncbi:radical SAM protein [Eggerthellaceae bacterium 24-137]
MVNGAKFFRVHKVPMLGNPGTGHVIGLSADEVIAAQAFATGSATLEEVACANVDLAEQMRQGGYSDEAPVGVRSAYLHVTHRCNLRCEGCYSWEGHRNRRPDPTLAQLECALRFLAQQGADEVNISGGEPFLRDDLPSVLEAAAVECGIPSVNVLTNGTVLDELLLETCAPFVSMVSVSFDGASADDAAWVRGEQRFDALVSFVRAAQKAGMSVCITPTLHRGNVEDIPRYLALADNLGTDVGFSLLSVGSAGGVRRELLPCEGDLRRLAELMLEAAETGGSPAVDSLACRLACRENCGAGITSLSVAADGSVYPCHMMHDDRFLMGNAFAGNGPARKDREAVAARVHAWDAESACHSCEYRWLCGGGCRARAIGSQTREDPYCETHRAFFSGVFDQIEQQLTKEEDHAVSH